MTEGIDKLQWVKNDTSCIGPVIQRFNLPSPPLRLAHSMQDTFNEGSLHVLLTSKRSDGLGSGLIVRQLRYNCNEDCASWGRSDDNHVSKQSTLYEQLTDALQHGGHESGFDIP